MNEIFYFPFFFSFFQTEILENESLKSDYVIHREWFQLLLFSNTFRGKSIKIDSKIHLKLNLK